MMDDRERQRFRTLVYMVVEGTARHVKMNADGARLVATAAADAVEVKLREMGETTEEKRGPCVG